MKSALVFALLLGGCASVADIDTSKMDPACAQSCSSTYSECLGKFTLFPLMAQHQCTDAMHLCSNACPARSAVVSSPAPTVPQRLSSLDDLYKRGLITKDEYDAKRADILKSM